VTLDSNGNVDFEGASDTRVLGSASKRVSVEHARAVFDELAAMKFLESSSQYSGGFKGCARAFTDHPWITITLETADVRKAVRLDTGCRDSSVAEALKDVARRIDEAAETSPWVGTGP
jgi:hypothetical protein